MDQAIRILLGQTEIAAHSQFHVVGMCSQTKNFGEKLHQMADSKSEFHHRCRFTINSYRCPSILPKAAPLPKGFRAVACP
jgi:hypothetical protein